MLHGGGTLHVRAILISKKVTKEGEVMPYAHGPSVRKLSKIATLLLARNYILMLNSSLDEMKKLVSDIYQVSILKLHKV